jgi:hypothetical protein
MTNHDIVHPRRSISFPYDSENYSMQMWSRYSASVPVLLAQRELSGHGYGCHRSFFTSFFWSHRDTECKHKHANNDETIENAEENLSTNCIHMAVAGRWSKILRRRAREWCTGILLERVLSRNEISYISFKEQNQESCNSQPIYDGPHGLQQVQQRKRRYFLGGHGGYRSNENSTVQSVRPAKWQWRKFAYRRIPFTSVCTSANDAILGIDSSGSFMISLGYNDSVHNDDNAVLSINLKCKLIVLDSFIDEANTYLIRKHATFF